MRATKNDCGRSYYLHQVTPEFSVSKCPDFTPPCDQKQAQREDPRPAVFLGYHRELVELEKQLQRLFETFDPNYPDGFDNGDQIPTQVQPQEGPGVPTEEEEEEEEEEDSDSSNTRTCSETNGRWRPPPGRRSACRCL